MKYHQFVARIFYLTTTTHGIGFIGKKKKKNYFFFFFYFQTFFFFIFFSVSFRSELVKLFEIDYGTKFGPAAWILINVIVSLSWFSCFRRRFFEIFYYFHHLFIPLIVFVFLHILFINDSWSNLAVLYLFPGKYYFIKHFLIIFIICILFMYF